MNNIVRWCASIFRPVRTAKNNISLRICAVWTESSVFTYKSIGSMAIHRAPSEDSVQTARMHRLIWVYDRRTNLKVHICHRGGKSTWPDRDPNPGPLAHRASSPANRATKPLGRPATISPCLNRFVPESARNHAGTDETVPLLLAARARTHTEPPNVTGEEKAHGPTGTRTQDLSHTVRALQPAEPQRHTVDLRHIHVRRYMHMSEVTCSSPNVHAHVRG